MLADFRGAANSLHVAVARAHHGPLACKRSEHSGGEEVRAGKGHEPLVYFASASFRAVTLPRFVAVVVVAKLDSWWFPRK